jgi:hypothetical protein
MKHLNKPGDNLGGLLKIWAAPFGVFTTQGNTVNFASQANIWEIYCSADSMEFTESSELTPAGTHFNTVISGFIPQDNATLQEAIDYMEPRKWGVIFMDGNGNYKLAGNQTDPLRVTAEINTGKDTASLAGCSIRFSGKTKTRSRFINKPF